jgi:hypothetical protein
MIMFMIIISEIDQNIFSVEQLYSKSEVQSALSN